MDRLLERLKSATAYHQLGGDYDCENMLNDLGIGRGDFLRWKQGLCYPSGKMVLMMANYMGVSAEWLENGEGAML